MATSRRSFLKLSAALAAGFAGLRRATSDTVPRAADLDPEVGYGPLISDPGGVIDLPAGFSYRVFSKAGERMDDGLLVPSLHDGMAAFEGGNGKTVLIRNHECDLLPMEHGGFGTNLELLSRVDSRYLYDCGRGQGPPLGGTTTVIFDTRTQRVQKQFMSLAGTLRNCAGGPTPWGSWISCEETIRLADDALERDHGYNFEVPTSLNSQPVKPKPLKAMGRFRHEAVAVDPQTGIVYETEDIEDGLIYRFLPNRPGDLAAGGRLQALAIQNAPSVDTRNWDLKQLEPTAEDSPPTIQQGSVFDTEWIDLDEVESPKDDLRYRGFTSGAARFARGEGMWYGNGFVYIACTNGGRKQLGQIWRYRPSSSEGQIKEGKTPGQLELFIESQDSTLIENCDNLTVAPWGDVILSEDAAVQSHLVGVTPSGQVYCFARNVFSDSEMAGVTFAPDGTTLFVNLQYDGLTLAITGPWRRNFLPS